MRIKYMPNILYIKHYSVFWDLVKFVMCTFVSRVDMTFYILKKGTQSMKTWVDMTFYILKKRYTVHEN